MKNEKLSLGEYPDTFADVINIFCKIAPTHITTEDIGDYEIGYPSWDGEIRNGLILESEVAEDADLGSKVRCRVIGDAEMGIALILRSRNPFDRRCHGYYIQPIKDDENNLRKFEIWKAPATKPKRGEVYWGIELLNREKAEMASPSLSSALIESLRQKAE